jgi:hypothetical protein
MCFLAGAVWSKLLTQIAGPQQNDHPLRFRDYPKLPKFSRHRAAVALISAVAP